jgi:hypothetical protein
MKAFLCHAQSDHQLQNCDLDVKEGGARFIKKFAGVDVCSVPNCTFGIQPQAGSVLDRIKGFLSYPCLATRLLACAKK